MKVIIPTKNRSGIMSTHRVRAFEDADIHVLVHNHSQYREYNSYLRDSGPNVTLHCTYTEPDTFGLTRQREWACRNLVGTGEWFVFADDNITKLTGPSLFWRAARQLPVTDNEPFTHPRFPDQELTWKSVFEHQFDAAEFRTIFRDDCARADKAQTCLVGFATNGNHFFRAKKIRDVGYVIGKMMLWCNDPGFTWDHTISMEDFRNTGEALKRYGSVIIDNWLFPACTHYQPGGMGTYRERVPVRRGDVKKLLAEYPGLFRVKQRADFEPDTDLSVRFNTLRQVDNWRSSLK